MISGGGEVGDGLTMAKGGDKKRMVKLVVDMEVYRDIVKETLKSTIGFSRVPSARHRPY